MPYYSVNREEPHSTLTRTTGTGLAGSWELLTKARVGGIHRTRSQRITRVEANTATKKGSQL